MPLTRVQAEVILVSRLGGLLRAANMAVTVVGTNANLDEPFAWALQAMGEDFTVSVSDVELADIADTDIPCFLDFAELRTLEDISGNLAFMMPLDKWGSKKAVLMTEHVAKKIERVKSRLSEFCGWGDQQEPAFGRVDLNFLEHG